MFEQFTVEEINLMCIFDTSSRDALIASLAAAIPGFDEPELVEIAEGAINRLSLMSSAGFAALELFPEYNDYGDYDEQEE
jgi:hypothetical protein